MLQKLNNFIEKNYLWLFVAFLVLIFIRFDAVLLLNYIEVIRWPLVVLVVLWFFKKEIRILTTEKLKHFFIKVFGVELQGSLADQANESRLNTEIEGLPNEMIQEKINELAQTKEILTNTVEAVETLSRNLAIKEIELDFERIYSRIFGSQFSLLENIIVNGGVVKFDYVSGWYSVTQNEYLLFKDWNVFQYIGFLQNNGLIQYDSINNVVKITEKGKAFMNYIRLVMMYAGYKPF